MLIWFMRGFCAYTLCEPGSILCVSRCVVYCMHARLFSLVIASVDTPKRVASHRSRVWSARSFFLRASFRHTAWTCLDKIPHPNNHKPSCCSPPPSSCSTFFLNPPFASVFLKKTHWIYSDLNNNYSIPSQIALLSGNSAMMKLLSVLRRSLLFCLYAALPLSTCGFLIAFLDLNHHLRK